MMTRRDLWTVAAVGGAAAFAQSDLKKLTPPPKGSIPVAFVLSPGAVVIDYTGPWEVFQDTVLPGRQSPFGLYTVAEKAGPVTCSAGLKVVADYSFSDAPPPRIVVIPAQQGGAAVEAWLKRAAPAADLLMSVCTGAFLLARTGLLDGKSATTHHASYVAFSKAFPQVTLKRGFRFVDEGAVASSGGLTSGIDLALHVVERYFGRDAAMNTAYYMEYQGRGWMNATGAANSEYAAAKPPVGAALADPVCGMPVRTDSKFASKRDGKTYYFCQQSCKDQFDADPAAFVAAPGSGKMKP
jgi:transcriptional regulator GlxA family with amidase domain/YHS domain-containing protein